MNNYLCLVDTSAFIALNNLSDANHQEALTAAKALDRYRFIVTDAIISETYTLLRYRLGFPIAERFLDIVLNDPDYDIVEINSLMRTEAVQLLNQYQDHKISWCDALSVIATKQLNTPYVFAFDHHFELMGMTLVQHQL